MYRREAAEARRIARGRIDYLFSLAAACTEKSQEEWGRKYISLAKRIGMRLDLPVGHRREYCRHCMTYFIPSRTVRIRIARGRVIMTCLHCGHVARFPYRR